MTWHVPATESMLSGSSSPTCRRGVVFPRCPDRPPKHGICQSSGRPNDTGYIHARTDQRKQGSLRLHPPSSLGAAIDEASTTRAGCLFSLRSLRHDLPAAESPPTSSREEKQSRRAEPKQNDAPAATHGQLPARGAWRNTTLCLMR